MFSIKEDERLWTGKQRYVRLWNILNGLYDGFKGELFVLEQERKKLQDQNLLVKNYPRHVSIESDIYGYDILSKDEVGNDIYIEVKTTTKREGDFKADMFYLSNNEYQMFLDLGRWLH